MGSVTTGRARPAEQLGVKLPVPIRVTEYRLRHGHLQTDGCWRDASSRQWDACRPTCGRFVVAAPDAPPRSGSSRAPVVVGNLGYDVSFTGPKSYSLPPAFADSDTATAATVEAVYTEAVGRTFGWLERHRQARRVDRGAARRPGFDPGEASRAVQRLAEQRTRGRRPRRSRPRTPPCANSGGPRPAPAAGTRGRSPAECSPAAGRTGRTGRTGQGIRTTVRPPPARKASPRWRGRLGERAPAGRPGPRPAARAPGTPPAPPARPGRRPPSPAPPWRR